MIKAQGLTDLQQSFLKIFWQEIGCFVTRAIDYSYEHKMFFEQNKIGIIPKAGKPKQFLKNWRPISLLNLVYKPASGCIAERIKGFFNKIIHCDQTGFIEGRFIGENIRLVYDIMHYKEIIQVPGLLMVNDSEKAFNTVSWNIIKDSLHDSIKSWIYTFCNDIKSCGIQNGVVSDYF